MKASHYEIKFTDFILKTSPILLLFRIFHQLQYTMHFNHMFYKLPHLPFLSP